MPKFTSQQERNANLHPKIKEGYFNHFHGSLKSLKDMTKLRYLNIEATDINSGLEYLPNSLEYFYCTSHDSRTRVDKIEKILKECNPRTLPIRPLSPQTAALGRRGVAEVETNPLNPNPSPNYIDNLQVWRNDNLIREIRGDDRNFRPSVPSRPLPSLPPQGNNVGDTANPFYNNNPHATRMEEVSEEEFESRIGIPPRNN